MALVLKGGRVVNADGIYEADVRMEGGRIVSVGSDVLRPHDEVRDVTGRLVMPGGVDVHTHFDLPLADGSRSADSFLPAQGPRSPAAQLASSTTLHNSVTKRSGKD